MFVYDMCWQYYLVIVASFPESPPSFFLDLLFPGLEGKLADALGEL